MDADSFLFSTAVKMMYENPFKPDTMVSPWHIVKESFDKKLEFFIERNKIDKLTMYVAGSNNFRYLLTDTYKANRKTSEPPIQLLRLRDYAVEQHGAIRADGGEADDYTVSYKLKNPNVTMSAIDKDVLNAVSGKHYNYWKEEFVETSDEWALKFPFVQCLMGDNSDNVIGLHGIGPKKAEKLLSEALEPSQMWDIVVSTYKSHSRSEEEALLNMRLIRMDQLDHETKTLTLWNP